MLSRKVKPSEIRPPITAIPPHLQVVYSPSLRGPTSIPGSRPGSPFSPRSATASPPIQASSMPPLPPKVEFDADIDLAIISLSQAILRMGEVLSIEFSLACRASESFSERNGHQLQFIIQHTRQPLKSTATTVNTAEIASILNSPPPLPSKQPLVESPNAMKPKTSLETIRLPPPDDDDLPVSIDPDAIIFLGSSSENLQPLQLKQIPGQDKTQGHIQFTLKYTTLRPGFTAIGGLRLYVVEDIGRTKNARLLRKWDTIAEVWIKPM